MTTTMTTTTKGAIYKGHRKLVYDTPRWDRQLFEARANGGAVKDAIGAVANGERTGAGASPTRATENARDLGTEVFSRLYGSPDKLETPATDPAWASAAHGLLDALPEFDGLREAVAGDPDMAALAASECMQALSGKVGDLAKVAEQKRQEDEANGNGSPSNGAANGSPSNGSPSNGSGSGASARSASAAAVRAALRKGIAKATQRVSEAREALSGLAPGLESAPPTHEQQDAGRLALAENLLRNPRLRDVLRRAGRIARLARDRRTSRDTHAREEIVDVERGADLARILPAGLARLRHPLLRKVALREIVERQAVQYKLEGRETLGRGPIVVLLDRSGSMQGDPELWASATAIALMGAGAREKRAVTVVEFTYSVDTVSKVVGSKGSRLSPSDPAVVVDADLAVSTLAIELASRRSTGGTSFGPVLAYGMRCGVLDDRADLVFVTDGLATADDATLDALRDAKKRGLRVYALTVNGGSLAPAIEAIADVAIDLDAVEDVGAAIAKAMPE